MNKNAPFFVRIMYEKGGILQPDVMYGQLYERPKPKTQLIDTALEISASALSPRYLQAHFNLMEKIKKLNFATLSHSTL